MRYEDCGAYDGLKGLELGFRRFSIGPSLQPPCGFLWAGKDCQRYFHVIVNMNFKKKDLRPRGIPLCKSFIHDNVKKVKSYF